MKAILRRAGAGVAATLITSALSLAAAIEANATSSAAPPWLTRINMYRTLDELAPLSNDPQLTAGAQDHAVYLVRNFGKRIREGGAASAEMSTEFSRKPFYTNAGLTVAPHSEIDFGFGDHQSQDEAIDRWIKGPRHRMLLLNPALERIGYGYYCEASLCAQVLDVEDGISKAPTNPDEQVAIEFPPANSTISLNNLTIESPDPLTACPGYAYPVGLPITFQIGSFVEAKLGSYSIVGGKGSRQAPIEACGYDAFSYQNPKRSQMAAAIGNLKAFGAVVVIPRRPLAPGTYRADIVVNDKHYGWPFTIAPGASHASTR